MLQYLKIIRCILKTSVDHCSACSLELLASLSSSFPNRFGQLINVLVQEEALLIPDGTNTCGH